MTLKAQRTAGVPALKFFAEALQSDGTDIQQGATSERVHLGATAGTVDLIQRVSTGLEVKGDVLRVDPELPQEMARRRQLRCASTARSASSLAALPVCFD